MDPALVESARAGELLLFVGAGMSRTLGLPSFSGLSAQMAKDLGYDPDLFRTLGDDPTLAEFYSLKEGGLGRLRSRLDAEWHDPTIDIRESRCHQLLLRLNCRTIYTTNWDRWLERAHEQAGIQHHAIVGVADMAKEPLGAVRIIKFHGDFSDDSSLILTEDNYMKRMDLNSPLDVRLRSDAMGKSILFLGYSLRDPNLRLILYRLKELWRGTEFEGAQPRSFLITDRINTVQQTVLAHWNVQTIVSDWHEDRAAALAGVLGELVHGMEGPLPS